MEIANHASNLQGWKRKAELNRHFIKLDILNDIDATIPWKRNTPLRDVVRRSDHGAGEIFRTHPDRPWGPPRLLFSGRRFSFLGIKRQGCVVNHPHPSIVKVKERVQIYPYSPSGPSLPVLGWTFCLLRCSFLTLRSHSRLQEHHYSAPQYAVSVVSLTLLQAGTELFIMERRAHFGYLVSNFKYGW